MAEGLWDCESRTAEGLAQRADEDPVGLVQSSDMIFSGTVRKYVCLLVTNRQAASPDAK